MKKIILIFLLFFLIACGDDNELPQIIITGSPDTPVQVPGPTNETVKISVRTGNEIKFYDGDNIWEWESGQRIKSTSHIYSCDDVLYVLDDYGVEIDSKNLVIIPDEVELNGSDVWISETINPDDALAMGAMYKNYTRYYLNDSESGTWALNDYVITDLISLNGNVFAEKENGSFVHINGSLTDIHSVVEKGFAIYDFDSGTRTATIDGIGIEWKTNYMNSAKKWLQSGTMWYSQNGYTWDGAVLDEDYSTMSDWRAFQNIMISAGTNFENSEDVLYFINCSTGWLIRYVPSTNNYTEHVRLYTGDGTTETGVFYLNILLPVISDGYLYFIFDAQVYRHHFETSITSYFMNGVSEIINY